MRLLTSILSSIILIDCRVKALTLSKTSSALLLNSINKTHRVISSNLSYHRYRRSMSTFVSAETKNDVIYPETQRSNPLLQSWSSNPFGLPPFTSTVPSDFEYALEYSMKQHLDELSTIASNSEPPTFENTIAPFDRSGRLFYRVNNMFDNLCSSNSPPELQAVELKMASHVASHYNKITSLPGLFHRINTIYESRLTSGEYTAEQLRLIERFHLDFVRSGAMFSEEDQKRYAAITEKLAELCTIFTQNVLTDESEITLDLKDTSNDLLGLPNDLIACAKQAAIERNKPDDTYVITLSRSLVEPFITFSERADLREKAWRLWTKRGELDSGRDNLAVAKQILQLRVEQAGMHGYKVSMIHHYIHWSEDDYCCYD